MNLGLFLSVSDSLTKQKKTGQLERLIKYYLRPYSQKFRRIYLFTYGDSGQKFFLPRGVFLVAKPKFLPTYFYQLVLPFVHAKIIRDIDVNRVFQTPGGLPAVMAKIFFHKPYVVTYGYDYIRFTQIEHQPALTLAFSFVVPFVLHFADKIITTYSHSLKKINTVSIHNGVDPRVFKPWKHSREKYLVLSVGRLVIQKDHQRLIKVISLSRFKNKIKLIIIGLGPLRNKLLALSQKLGVDLKIIPNVSYTQLVAWYQKAAVFGLTSIIEGQVKVLLEALSAGCASVTTPFIGNMTENNLTGLIDSSNHGLAAKLDRLLSDRDLNLVLGQRARQLVIDQFDLVKLVQKEIKLLQSC